jgi:dTDP-4-dehydrorhamnose reductase
MSKTILVTGANGQLGCSIRRLAAARPEAVFYFTDVDTLDLCDGAQTLDYLEHNGVDCVLNCAAYTAVDRAEDDAERCMAVNCEAVKMLGTACEALGIELIHVSTDYVFDGASDRPYREDDRPNPQSVYGASKLAGEEALRATCRGAVIVRTAWLYSEFGKNFLKTMMALGRTRDAVGVVSDQVGTPTYAGDLAEALLIIADSGQLPGGTYHYTNEGVCSWYEFASKIMAYAGLACRVTPIATCDYPTRAVRPAYSVLDKTKIKRTFGVETPGWETGLKRAIERLESSTLYHT